MVSKLLTKKLFAVSVTGSMLAVVLTYVAHNPSSDASTSHDHIGPLAKSNLGDHCPSHNTQSALLTLKHQDSATDLDTVMIAGCEGVF